jgi:hypothetical protein
MKTTCTAKMDGTSKICAKSGKGTTEVTLFPSTSEIFAYAYTGLEFVIHVAKDDSGVFTNYGASTTHASCDSGKYVYDIPPNDPTTI